FLEMLAAERGVAANTLEAYRRDLESFSGFLSRSNTVPEAARATHISAYLKAMTEDGMAPSSRARRLSALRQFYRFLLAEGRIAEDPAHGIQGPKLGQALPKTLSVAEVDKLIETARRRIAGTVGRERFAAL